VSEGEILHANVVRRKESPPPAHIEGKSLRLRGCGFPSSTSRISSSILFCFGSMSLRLRDCGCSCCIRRICLGARFEVLSLRLRGCKFPPSAQQIPYNTRSQVKSLRLRGWLFPSITPFDALSLKLRGAMFLSRSRGIFCQSLF